MKTHVFVDGFNLYNGVALPLDCKWVDLFAYFRSEFPGHDISRVVFCTSLVLGATRKNQIKYVNALESTGVELQFGVFEKRMIKCSLNCSHPKREFHRPIEKRTDVRLGSLMVLAAAQKKCEQIILVTGDSDFIPSVEICIDLGIPVHVHVPTMPKAYSEFRAKLYGEENPGAYANQIRSAASKYSYLNLDRFLAAQFQSEFEINGVTHKIPKSWKRQSIYHYKRMLGKLQENANKTAANHAAAAVASHRFGQHLKSKLNLPE